MRNTDYYWKDFTPKITYISKIGEGRCIIIYIDLLHGKGHGHRVKHVLELSYDCLPYYLKQCFLYIGCFGQDGNLDSKKLYFWLMAEGLILTKIESHTQTLRDVVERYLN